MSNNNIWDKYLSVKRLSGGSRADDLRKAPDTMDNRTGAESDLGRVIFTTAARRLHDKTQVFPLVDNDHTHSRLTHSLEVVNAGMGFALLMLGKECKDENYKKRLAKFGVTSEQVLRYIQPILMTSCLVHDIGNPPFGHFGEEVVSDYFTNLIKELQDCYHNGKSSKNKLVSQILQYSNMKTKDKDGNERVEEDKIRRDAFHEFINDENKKYDYTQFDGNAQGFRILTKLQYIDNLYGLNLTMGTLAATLKYPNAGKKYRQGPIGMHKHGVFTTEWMHLDNVAKECGLITEDGKYKRHPLAFLMEAADSICYTVMDLDDAYDKGLITSRVIKNSLDTARKKTIDEAEKANVKIEIKESIAENYKRLTDKPLDGDDGPDWTNYRNAIIKHLMDVAFVNFLDNFNDIVKGDYRNELLEDRYNNDGSEKKEWEYDRTAIVLQKLCHEVVFPNRSVRTLEVTGRAVITGLFNIYFGLLFHEDEKFRKHGMSLMSRSNVMTTLHEHFDALNKENVAEKVIEAYNNDFDPIELSVEEIFRIVRDEVAGMTDNYALDQYQRLSGQNI